MNRSLRTHVCFTFSSSLRIRSLSSNAFISKCRFSSSDMRFHIFTSARFTSFVFHSAHKPDHSHKRGFCARISSRFSLQKYMYAERARAAEMEEFRLDRFRSSVLSFTPPSSRYVNPRAFSSFRYPPLPPVCTAVPQTIPQTQPLSVQASNCSTPVPVVDSLPSD